MIVDTSAIMAVVLAESDAERMLQKLADAPVRRLSAGTWLELGVVIQRRYPSKAAVADEFVRYGNFELVPVTVEYASAGREAYRLYGQNSGHRARLNFGDCFAYALAKATGEPLLCKGDDFVHTDLVLA